VLPIAQQLCPLEGAIKALEDPRLPRVGWLDATDETEPAAGFFGALWGVPGSCAASCMSCRRKGMRSRGAGRRRGAAKVPELQDELWPKALAAPVALHDCAAPRNVARTSRACRSSSLSDAPPRRPRLTANVYKRVDLAESARGKSRGCRRLSHCVPRGPISQKTRAASSREPEQSRALDWSGRQDLNLRPPVPNGTNGIPTVFRLAPHPTAGNHKRRGAGPVRMA